MSENIRFTCQKPARLIFSSITQKSAPRTIANAEPKFSGTFGIEQEDFDAICKIMVQAIQAELGSFSGNPGDYYLGCQSSEQAVRRTMQAAEFNARGKSPDEAFKIKEKAENRCKLYQPYAGILQASSKFPVELARLEAGKIVDIPAEDHVLAQAGRDFFYPGAYVAPAVAFSAFRGKKVDDKDGVTAYLQNVLFIRKGERIGGMGPDNRSVFSNYSGYSDYDPTAMAPDGQQQMDNSAWGDPNQGQQQMDNSAWGDPNQGQTPPGQSDQLPGGF